jgi:hypothetical protein
MKVLERRIVPWIVNNNRLSPKQKGSMPRNGLQEHVFCINSSITDFRHQSGKLYVNFIDLADAFGSINHEFMIDSLRVYGYPEPIVNLTQDIYTNSYFQVESSDGCTEFIHRQRGIIQGCPHSVIVFEQGIDIWLRWMTINNNIVSIPNPVQGYVDDIALCSTNDTDLIQMCDKTQRFVTCTGMQIKHRKCAILHGQRTGNNWSKKDTTTRLEISVQNKPIPKLGKADSYTYLGHDISLDGKAAESQLASIVHEFHTTLTKINDSLLPIVANVQAINQMAISKLNFYFPNISFPLKTLIAMEDSIVKYIRIWFKFNKSSNRDIIFIPSSKGGLGVLSPSTMYISKKITFLLQCLNSDDPQTRFSARSSFHLHMSKRKAIFHDMDDPELSLFGNYEVDGEGRVIKKGKVNWPKSVWVEFNELCIREKLTLEIYNDLYAIVADQDESVQFVFRSHSALATHLKNSHTKKRINRLSNLKSQGRIFKNGADQGLSSKYLSNLALNDDIIKFTLKSRLQLLECNSLLHKYYPNVYPKKCRLCNNPYDTVSHIMNGCMLFKNNYIARHDRIVAHIRGEIMKIHPQVNIFSDQPLTGDMLGVQTDFQYIQHRKPDLFMCDRRTMKAFIIEISCPFDAFINTSYHTKFQYYKPLHEHINLDTGYTCKTIVIIVGSLGSIHKKLTSGLKMIGFTNKRSKVIAKYLSISAAIGSNIVWKKRARLHSRNN